MNFFADSFLVDKRVVKSYENFISAVYAVNELNEHAFSFQEICGLPYPLFQDYVAYQLSEKKKDANRRKQEMNKYQKS